MVLFFSKDDLVIFGNQMVSKERRKYYSENPLSKNNLEEYLGRVNDYDIETFMYYLSTLDNTRSEKSDNIENLSTLDLEEVLEDELKNNITNDINESTNSK